MLGHASKEAQSLRSSTPPASSRLVGEAPLSDTDISFLDEAMAAPHTTRGPIDDLLGDLEEGVGDEQEEDGIDIYPGLKDMLLESLGTIHSARGSAGSSADIAQHNDNEK
ncbi:hypothetical protein HAX54_019241 [Datura stramonium]|uniref:Uncharacterized protein n=1 Tax=Datura stramonium TaxID=4076 RepID=A0ABS8UNR8_DATST|nr:hypothetical protein [Datura stramonium]